MSQYHVPVNISRKEYFQPRLIACGAQQFSQGSINAWRTNDGEYCTDPADEHQVNVSSITSVALYASLCTSIARGGGDYEDHPWLGRWAGGIVVVAGDYGERGDIATRSGTGDSARDDSDLYYNCCPANDEAWKMTLAWAKERSTEPRSNDPEFYERLVKLGRFTDVTPMVEHWFLSEFGMLVVNHELKFVGKPVSVA